MTQVTQTTNTNIFASIEAWMKTKEQEIVAFGEEFVEDAETYIELGADQLAEIVGQAVFGQAAEAATGEEKFGTAVDNVVEGVETAGKTIAQQTAGMLVQKAYLDAQTIAAAAKPATQQAEQQGS